MTKITHRIHIPKAVTREAVILPEGFADELTEWTKNWIRPIQITITWESMADGLVPRPITLRFNDLGMVYFEDKDGDSEGI